MARGIPSMTALLGMLALAGYQNRDKIAEMLKGATAGGSSAQGGFGALLGSLGGATGAGGISSGGLLSGGLASLIEAFKQNGQAEVADSWVGTGPNKQVAPPDIKQAIGQEVLGELVQKTGLSEQEILSRLSQRLPEAVDKYTPDGRLPAQN
jgi:uncharacterized protein YidB (DUF937 family)